MSKTALVCALTLLPLLEACSERCVTTLDCSSDQACSGGTCYDPRELPPPAPKVDHDGWNDPPGSGAMFLIDTFRFGAAGEGLDLDGKCRGPGDCVDNSFGPAWAGHESSLTRSGSDAPLLLEIAGVDQLEDGEGVTIKLYLGMTGSQTPPRIDPRSLQNGQALARNQARLVGGHLRSVESSRLSFVLTYGVPPYPTVALADLKLDLTLPRPDRDLSGWIGAALPISTLAPLLIVYCWTTSDPLCPEQTSPPSLWPVYALDLAVAKVGQPDLDLDGGGLDRLVLGPDGHVDACFDGHGRKVPPTVASDPSSCALTLGDAYSFAIEIHAVRTASVSRP